MGKASPPTLAAAAPSTLPGEHSPVCILVVHVQALGRSQELCREKRRRSGQEAEPTSPRMAPGTPCEPHPAATPTSQRAEQRLAHPGGLSSPLTPCSPPRTLNRLTQLKLRPFPPPIPPAPSLRAPGTGQTPRSSCRPGSVRWHFPPLYRQQHPKIAEQGHFAPHSAPCACCCRQGPAHRPHGWHFYGWGRG